MSAHLISSIRRYHAHYAGLSATCWQGILLSLFESALTGTYYFLQLYFINELKISITTAGLIMSFYGIGTILGGFVGGKLSDKMSSGLVATISILIQGVTLLAIIKIQSAPFLMMDLFLMGLACYSFITANHIWVLDKCDQEFQKLKAINILNSASNLGFGLSAAMIGFCLDYGFHRVLLVVGVFLLMSAIYSSFLNNNLNRVNKVAADSASSTTKNKVDKKIVRLVLAILFLVGLIIFQISTTYSIYIKEYFPVYGTHGLGVLFAINAFMVVFLQTPIVNWFQAYNKVLLVGLGAFLMGVGMFVLVFPSFFLFAVISCVIYTVGEMLFFSVAQYICYQYGDDNKKGHSMAIYRMVYASSRVLAPIGGSFIYQELGGKSLWVICGLIGIGCLLACYSFREKS